MLQVLLCTLSQAQDYRVYGMITDAESGEALPMATVSVLATSKGAVANVYGHYQLLLEAGSGPVELVYRFVGYEPDTVLLSAQRDTLINMRLAGSALAAVEVSTARERAAIGMLALPVPRLKTLPVLLGEIDLFKSLAMLPGIATGTEGSSGLFVRGGSPDQNLVLLDGSTIYNTGHLFGFLSAFYPSAVKDIQVIKGGFPARYGGRLSSVVNVTMREGNRNEHKRENTFGLINMGTVREGPLQQGRGSYLVAGRLAQLGAISLATLPGYYRGDPWLLAGMYDLNGKVNFQLRDSSRLFLSAYLGDDIWGIKERMPEGTQSEILIGWGNKTVSARYTKAYSPALFGQSMLNFNDFAYQVRAGSRSSSIGSRYIKVASRIREVTARQWFTWSAAPQHEVHFGMEAALPIFRPLRVQQLLEGQPIDGGASSSVVRAVSGALFWEDDWSVSSSWAVSTGLRWSVYRAQGKTFHGPEPRLSATWQYAGNQRCQFGYSRMAQFVHLVTNSSAGLSNDLWVPATRGVPPQSADQFFAGWAVDFDKLALVSEIFYKKLKGQAELGQGASFVFNGNLDWQEALVSGGAGQVYGWEFLANKHTGRLTGWLAYTLSWNDRQFASINQGRPYPFKYDRRHDISLTASYRISSRLKCASSFVFQTGHAISLPEALHETFGLSLDRRPEVGAQPLFVSPNNHRMPNYHRLDINFTYEYYTKKWKDASLSIGAYNVYGQPNPLFIDWEGNPIEFRQFVLFRFIPSFNYTVKW